MIRRVGASDHRFNEVSFRTGFNLVLGASTQDSSSKDSTNGVGKSSLVELMHFALGSEPAPGEYPRIPALEGWQFHFELVVSEAVVEIQRAVDDPGKLIVTGAPASWRTSKPDGTLRLSRSAWTRLLAESLFGCRPDDLTTANPPSFRQLIRHFVRYKDRDFQRPFDFFQGKKWQARRASAFILGLDWELQAHVGELEEKHEIAKQLRTQTGQKVLHGSGFDRADLEAEASRLSAEAEELQRQLDTFRVHEQYGELEREADRLTAALSRLSDANVVDEERIRLLGEAVAEVREGDAPAQVQAIYEEAGLLFPNAVTIHLDALTKFHRQLVRNRREFLAGEIEQKTGAMEARRREMTDLDARRAEVLEILKTHGALEQFQKLHARLGALRGRLEEVRGALARMEQLAKLRAEYKAEAAKLEVRARREHESRRSTREYAQRIYSLLVREMYSETGKLILNDTSTKYEFVPDIRAIRSTGVANLATACVDLLVARLWSERGQGPRLLVHDSRMFDGMDHRQVGHTLRTAKNQSEKYGYTYVALLNERRFESARPFVGALDEDSIRLRLTDAEPSGALFGFRF